jgi:hypothetical protein
MADERHAFFGLVALVCGCNALTGDFAVGLGPSGATAGAATGGGGTGGSDGGTTVGNGACGTVAMLHDDFDDGLPSSAFADVVVGGATLGEEAGSAVMRMPAAPGAQAFRVSRHLYDLRNEELRLELREVPDPAAGDAWAYLSVRTDSTNVVSILAAGFPAMPGRIAATGPSSVLGNLPYDPVDHRWWRIVEDAGVLRIETSSDGARWTTLGEAAVSDLFDVSAVEVLYGAYVTSTTVPVQARFDRMNGGGAFAPAWCPVADLADAFDDGKPAAAWNRKSLVGGCTAAETDRLDLALATDPGPTSCYYATGAAYDLRDGAVSVHVVENLITAPAPDYASVMLRVRHDDDAAAALVQTGDLLRAVAYTTEGTAIVREVPYEAAAHAWWRLREDGGTFYWETSSDGERFAPLYAAATFFPADAVDVLVGIAAADTNYASGSVALDDLNLPPR